MQLEHVGLNHLTWERKVLVDGVDRLPELLADPPLEPGEDEFEGMPIEFIRALGAIPSYYLHYYYRTSAVLAHQRTGKTRAEEVMEIEAGLLELYRDPTLDTKPKLLEERGGAFYSDAAAALVASLHAGHRRRAGRERPQRRRDPEPAPTTTSSRSRAPSIATARTRCPSTPLAPEMHGLVAHAKAYEQLTIDGGDVAAAAPTRSGAHGEPADPGLGHRAAAARRAARGQPPLPAAVLPRRLSASPRGSSAALAWIFASASAASRMPRSPSRKTFSMK